MSTTYNPAIPGPANLISVSQGQIKTNFTQLNAQFGVDHTAFQTIAAVNGDGFHQKVTFNVPWGGSTSVSGTSVLLYGSNQGGVGQLAYANSTGQYLLTGPQSAAIPGYITLPGGLIFQWKKLSMPAGMDTVDFVYPVAYSSFVAVTGIVPSQQVQVWVPSGTIALNKLTVESLELGTFSVWVSVIGK